MDNKEREEREMREGEMMAENRRRREARKQQEEEYDQLSGRGCTGERREVMMWGTERMWLPTSITERADFKRSMKREKLEELRLREDFEYWCARCVKITDKLTGAETAFRLNRPQRKVTEALERQRREGKPIRMIILKSRQWGCSTLVEMYFAWIQLMKTEGWNSLICAHVKETAATIRGMYESMLKSYPRRLWAHKEEPGLKCSHRGGKEQLRIAGTRTKIAIGSSMAPDSLRGTAASLAHLSEVAFWSDTRKRKPLQFLRTVCGSIPSEPLTAIIIESTANGTGNYFHQSWLKAEQGESAFEPVFVAWHESRQWSTEASEEELEETARSMDSYERGLWDAGATLDQIKWYRGKRKEYIDHAAMKAEFPSNASEAFMNSGNSVFGHGAIEQLREGCTEPGKRYRLEGDRLTGPESLRNLRLKEDSQGELTIWREPKRTRRGGFWCGMSQYVVSVDIGGRSEGSDWSVIAVIKRRGGDEGEDSEEERDKIGGYGKPEVVAQWRGHADHDIVAWQAAKIAKWYDNALLVIESNSLETTAEDASMYILSTLRRHYNRLYVRETTDMCEPGRESRPGFHTNRRSKLAALTVLIAAVRDGEYIEHDEEALDELLTYERKPNGSYGAKDGHHDDILMTRAIGLYVISEQQRRIPPDEEPTFRGDLWW